MVVRYVVNGIKIVDNETELIVLSPFKGLYHFTFPGLLLGKYRTLFYDIIGNNDILYCLVFSTVPYEEEENADE